MRSNDGQDVTHSALFIYHEPAYVPTEEEADLYEGDPTTATDLAVIADDDAVVINLSSGEAALSVRLDRAQLYEMWAATERWMFQANDADRAYNLQQQRLQRAAEAVGQSVVRVDSGDDPSMT